ncbi:RNA recognition motif domain [Macleaya cordata]|uniref:RNA recognition motif domain n=1 Tax=Macleaya cordata TaxID=56857 RepID=A0A200R7L8_MACCD|nr:RNA recognition motif domain [Macleaya cordata]
MENLKRLNRHLYMGTPADKEYAAFEEKVKRTVYIDNLSPQVTEAVLKTALGQFGSVTNVQFIPNYIEQNNIPQCALVEMENAKQAKSIVSEMGNYPFMMSGMPRPVRARAAEIGMFGDRPIKPGRKITCRWVDIKDPDFEVAQKLKQLTRKHALEASYLVKLQLDEEEKLAQQQSEILKANYKKYEMLENLLSDGTVNRLAYRYNLNVPDD